MQAVGRIGSYISRSVYTASGPFHPFGGAVDIIVVQQPDGTYKSSPWYIRFGKFQGVLKTKEKVVTISVNGVEADFHMYLNHKGEAYFLKEIVEEDEDPVCSPPPRSGEDTNKVKNRMPMKSVNCTYDSDHSENKKVSVSRTDSRPSQIFRLVFDRKSTKDEENESVVSRTESLEHAKIAADLLDLKWSTNLVSPRCKKDKSSNNYNDSRFSASDISIDEVVQNLPVFCSSDQKGSSVEENGDDIKCLTEKFIPKSEFHVSSASVISEVAKSDSQIEDSVEKLNRDQFTLIHEKRVSISGGGSKYNASESIVGEYSQLVSIHQSNKENVSGEVEINKHEFSEGTIFYNKKSRTLEEEQLLFGNLDDFGLAGAKQLEFSREEKEADSLFLSRDGDGVNEFSDAKCCSGFSLDQSVLNDYIYDVDPQTRRLRSISSEVCIKKTDHVQSEDVIRVVRSLPIAGLLGNKLEASENHQSRGARTFEDDKILQESKEGNANPSVGTPLRPVDSLNGNQRSWPFPFKRSKSMKVSHIDACSIENPNTTEVLTNSSDLEWTKDVTEVKKNTKTFLRTLTPTSEQLTSLNLKEGKNIVVFTFQTAMLGKQQVDARIFIWRWDTRIVISDVDGTITRSDLLGQVMPLVGMDWSQTGVAHLFSAIKENGYQLLFLSARAIAQSFLTRQLLFNIKQDGKALPDGPVVISPDGLFPSLFREVVRRAPHEFKIACLEDIKALFPADTNPFYAGFGNRHTDEFSYLKVGIPRGKIFIVNPKGEIVVNRHVDTKSYLSLHGLVHGMFPPTTMSSSEQEDFNSWNFWKLTPATIDL